MRLRVTTMLGAMATVAIAFSTAGGSEDQQLEARDIGDMVKTAETLWLQTRDTAQPHSPGANTPRDLSNNPEVPAQLAHVVKARSDGAGTSKAGGYMTDSPKAGKPKGSKRKAIKNAVSRLFGGSTSHQSSPATSPLATASAAGPTEGKVGLASKIKSGNRLKWPPKKPKRPEMQVVQLGAGEEKRRDEERQGARLDRLQSTARNANNW